MRDFSRMYCCLAPLERVALDLTVLAFITSLGLPFPEAEWDAFWLPVTPDYLLRREAAIHLMGLERVLIPVPDEPPIPGIGIAAVAAWVELLAWMLTDAAICGNGCPTSSYY